MLVGVTLQRYSTRLSRDSAVSTFPNIYASCHIPSHKPCTATSRRGLVLNYYYYNVTIAQQCLAKLAEA